MDYNSKFLNKLFRYLIAFGIYIFILFLYFNFIFTFNKNYYEEKTEPQVSQNVQEKSTKNVENKNGIDISKLSTKINTGKVKTIPTEQAVLDSLNNSLDEDIKYIMKNKDKLDFSYLRILYNNNSAKLFIKDILENKVIDYYTGESAEFKRYIPYFLQWDRRWGNKNYGDYNIALYGCAPTCMAMIASGLLKDDSITPITFSQHTEYLNKFGTDWNYFNEIPKKYGINVKNIVLDKELFTKEVKAGHPIVINVMPGDFTSVGHYLVLVDVDDNGNFILNDPNSPNNSSEKWSFERLSTQIKNSWVFSR